MIEGKTKSGFKYKIDERCLTDYKIIEFVNQYDEADDMGKIQIVPKLTDFLLGTKGFEKLEKHIRSKNDGFCSIASLQTELYEIMNGTKEIKNS